MVLQTTLTALWELFEVARSIMSWLGDCAKGISHVVFHHLFHLRSLISALQAIDMKNNIVQWTTPLGLLVVQPYHKLGTHLIKPSLQVLKLQRETDKVMVKRQRRSFPPNFVHSLDESHMMMTTLPCKEAGLSFAGLMIKVCLFEEPDHVPVHTEDKIFYILYHVIVFLLVLPVHLQ